MTSLAAQSLFQHIHNKDVSAVANLLENGVINLDERDKDGQTLLMVACQVGSVEVTEMLLESPNVDVNAVDNDNWSALLNAAKEGHLEVLILLLEREADLEHRDMGGWTALMWACYKGREEVALRLLTSQANPNVRGEHNMSCLAWAAGRGHFRIVQMLISNGAKPNTADKYGTTPLMWAARKGYHDIVELLLEEGATIDNAGMNSWTALIMAAKGGYTSTVQLILDCAPNINAVDKDSYTALTHSAKEGYVEIAKLLLDTGAYINRPDRYGDTILIHATKGGHLEMVKLLLKRHVDMEVQGVDNKTALYWAVEKGHTVIVKLLLESNAGMEISNKDGDTPLLKAVRSRNLDIVKLLLDKGAKISATDKRGDNALHVAVRGRSKRITELLLRNPKDGRLLYRPNKTNETPYQLDSEHEKRVLTQVFGARNLNAEDNIEGYDLYSSTIADVLSEPSLTTPITVGLYAKWGSGKSFLIKKLCKEMRNFTQHNAEQLFAFGGLQFCLTFFMSLLVGVVLFLTLGWEIGLGVGLGVFTLQYVFLAIMWAGTMKKDWSWAYSTSVGLARKLQTLKLLLQVMFCNEPTITNRDTVAVKFLFTDNARLASIVGEKSITAMIGTLCDALEKEYGTMVTRLYKVLKPARVSEHGRFKSLCCIPYFLIVIFVICCIVTVISLIYVYGVKETFDSEISLVDGIVIAFLVVIGISFLGNIYTWSLVIGNLIIPPRKRVQRIMSRVDSIRMEGVIQNLKKEVELLGQLTRCMDAFLHNHTRLVVIVDGLDSCEQERLLQVLDTVHMLFSDDKSPFVTILAVDPHVIIKGIESNLQGLFRDSSINGHDYLQNLVQLPFFVHGQTKPRSRYSLAKVDRGEGGVPATSREHSTDADAPQGSGIPLHHINMAHQESVISGASVLSIPDINKSNLSKKKRTQLENSHSYGSTNLAKHTSQTDLSKSLGKSSYFSDINPRNMKRMTNIIAVTGRILRACNIDFNWYKLASWINLTEQWPYRLSWMIFEIDNNTEVKDAVPLRAVYEMVTPKLPPSREVDPRLEIDRNEHKLKVFLDSNNPRMTVGDIRRFMPCTINVDPYLRKLIKEHLQNQENMSYDYGLNMLNPGMPSSANLESYGMMMSGKRNNSRMELSPRSTPTRPSSAMRLAPGMIPGAGMFPYGVYPPGMIPGHYGPPGMLHQSASASSFSQRERASPRINIQGGLPSELLSSMTVEDICGLLYRLESLNKTRLPAYLQCLHEHNISGAVLLTCELDELKPVLMMTFGDWELFRTLVMTLRDREMTQDPSCHTPGDTTDGPRSPRLKFTQNIPPINADIKMPQPSYPGINFKSRKSLTDQHIRDPNEYPHSRSAPVMKKLGVHGNRSYQNFYPHSEPHGDINIARKDSFFGEVMMESAALRSVIEAVGVITDTGEDTEEEVVEESTRRAKSPVREERSPPKPNKPAKNQERSKSRKQKEDDPRYKIHNSESGDSDSEEVTLLARKASCKSLKGKGSNLPKLKLNSFSSTHNSVDSLHGSVYSEGGDKNKESSKVTRKSVVRRTKTTPDDEAAPLLSKAGDSQLKPPPAADLSLFLGSDEEEIDVKSEVSSTVNPTTSSTVTPVLDQTNPLATSSEHLSLRTLSQSENVQVPSAFKCITPSSSRASSRASSLGLSLASSNRGVSHEESLDGVRLSMCEGADSTSNVSLRTASKATPGTPCVRAEDSVVVDLSEGPTEGAHTAVFVESGRKVAQMGIDDTVVL